MKNYSSPFSYVLLKCWRCGNLFREFGLREKAMLPKEQAVALALSEQEPLCSSTRICPNCIADRSLSEKALDAIIEAEDDRVMRDIEDLVLRRR